MRITSERDTEDLLVEELIANGFNKKDIQKQSGIESGIKRLLRSKKNNNEGKGTPEHCIRLNGDAADILLTECKKNKTDHTSDPALDGNSELKAVKYAEDGIIHYMKCLSGEFNVIGLAVSGTTEDLQISTFRVLRGGVVERLPQKSTLSQEQYKDLLRKSHGYGYKSPEEIDKFAISLHEHLRDNMDLSEAYKPLLVSGILLALKYKYFEEGYLNCKNSEELARNLYAAISNTLDESNIKHEKQKAMMSNYDFIKTNQAVKKHLSETVTMVYQNLFFALHQNNNYDLLGNFYGEFLRYSGGDKQGLGIVLTPRHITDLFAELAELNPKTSTVLDICTGTGGFLISAMSNMIVKANSAKPVIERIKESGLIGIEIDPHMYTLGCANMIFRGDGKANMYWDDCLKNREGITDGKIRELRPNVAMLNPPYNKKSLDKHELRFVEKALDLLEPKGMCIVILPVSCMTETSNSVLQIRKEILEKHTLRAVMSMPEQLFPTVGVVSAIAVFTAHTPHNTSKDSWFGYWRDDGFVLSKNKRVERREGIWEEIKKDWLDMFFNERVIPGKSCKKTVGPADEWIAEAYMETDYSDLTPELFEKEMKKFVVFNFLREPGQVPENMFDLEVANG